MAEEKRRAKRWKLILNVVTILALAGLIYAVRDEIRETITNVGRVNLFALSLMIPAQIINYDTMVRMYRDLFGILGHKITYWRMMRVNLELNFVNNVFPSGGVSGFSYFGLRMRSEGVSSGQATLVQIFRFILLFISFQVLLFIGVIFLAIGGSVNNFTMLIAGSLATLLLVGTIAVAYIIGSKKRISAFSKYSTKTINKLINIFRRGKPEAIEPDKVERLFTDLHEGYLIFRKNPSVLKRPLVFALLANFAEIATIYVVYIAFGEWVNPGAVIIAYAIANFAGLISVLPGGVGIYEALMTAVLASAGVPAGVSIPVTIMYRVVNMAIQLPPGYIFYHQAVRRNELRP